MKRIAWNYTTVPQKEQLCNIKEWRYQPEAELSFQLAELLEESISNWFGGCFQFRPLKDN